MEQQQMMLLKRLDLKILEKIMMNRVMIFMTKNE
jgi:hypothetical protein